MCQRGESRHWQRFKNSGILRNKEIYLVMIDLTNFDLYEKSPAYCGLHIVHLSDSSCVLFVRCRLVHLYTFKFPVILFEGVGDIVCNDHSLPLSDLHRALLISSLTLRRPKKRRRKSIKTLWRNMRSRSNISVRIIDIHSPLFFTACYRILVFESSHCPSLLSIL